MKSLQCVVETAAAGQLTEAVQTDEYLWENT